MSSLVFTAVDLGILNRDANYDLTAGTFYMHLVTAVPLAAHTTVADLTLAAGGSYALSTLSGRTIATDGTGARFDFADPTWTELWCATAAPIVGGVTVKQLGGSPATSDRLIAYTHLIRSESANVTNCTVTSGSRAVTAVDNAFNGVVIGSAVSGTGIPGGATVVAVSGDGSAILISADATASGGAVTVSITREVSNPFIPATAVGGASNFTLTLPATGVLKLD